MQKIIIAIDGYSSCGKSTMAKQLASRLHYTYIDTGAMYRAITLYFMQHEVPLNDKEAIRQALANIRLKFVFNEESGKADIYLNNENVEKRIREMDIANRVSPVAAIQEVRTFAVTQQQAFGKEKGIVMDGRDIGTVVFPHAALKIFMTASPEIRVQRRLRELTEKGSPVTEEEVRKNLEERDYIDTHRAISPLIQAADARVLDNSNLSREEQLAQVLGWVKELTGKAS